MSTNLKKLSSIILALVITGCNNINTEPLSQDKEYLPFKTEALTMSYLERKLETWLGPPVKGDNLVKEIKFAMFKYPDLFKDLMLANPQLYIDINNNGDVNIQKTINDPFRLFLESVAPPPPGTFFVSTLAGGDFIFTDDNGTYAHFYAPYGIATNSSGNVYVGDAGSSERIRKIAPNGNVITLAGNGTYGSANGNGTNATFNEPGAIAVDCSGNVYAAEAGNNRIRKIDISNNVSTIAGSSYGFADGTDAKFRTPQGIAADCSGNVYVGDTGNQRIRKIDTNNSNTVSTIGGDGNEDFLDGTASKFANPHGIAVDSSGKVYVADRNNARIRIIDTNNSNNVTSISGFSSPEGIAVNGSGSIIVVSEPNSNSVKKIDTANNNAISSISGNGGFSHPVGVTIDNSGQYVFVGDVNNKLIKKIDLVNNNTVTTLAGNDNFYLDATGTRARLNNPHGIFRDGSGNIYIADTGNQRIRKIDINGNVTTIAGSGNYNFANGNGTNASFANPGALVADNAGNIYVADTGNQRIRKIDTNGEVTTIAGNNSQSFSEGNGASASFSNPFGITIDPAGNLYIADTNNQRIRMIDTSGNVTVIAGKEHSFAEGNGTNASFKNPYGITRDNNTGILYIADTENQRIRMIDTSGNVTTIAGNGSYGDSDGIGINASFKNPEGILFSAGILYIADTDGHRIRKLVISTGEVTTIAGDGNRGFVDGIGTHTSFANPFGITNDSAGNLYVSDVGNNRIRKLSQ
jgi:YVTN family beta-propeller protein